MQNAIGFNLLYGFLYQQNLFGHNFFAGLACFCRRMEKPFFPWKKTPGKNVFFGKNWFLPAKTQKPTNWFLLQLLSHSMTFS